MSDESKSLSIPKWDGKEESCPRYLAKLKALAEYYNCGDALDEGTMTSECSEESEFTTLQANSVLSDDEKKKVMLYKQNKRLCTVITLGQDSDHGLAAISRTVVKGKHPHGLAYKFLNILEEKYKPSDASVKVSLMSELRAIPFKMANDYYNDVVGVTTRYSVQLSETSLTEYLTEKVRDTSIAKIIVDHLEKPSGSHDLEALCKDISKVQCVANIYHGNNTNVKPDE